MNGFECEIDFGLVKPSKIKWKHKRTGDMFVPDTHQGAIHPNDMLSSSFEDFCKTLESPGLVGIGSDKGKTPMIYPYLFDEGGRTMWWNNEECIRKVSGNVVKVSMIVGDFDGGRTIEWARDEFKDYAYFLHTSFTHNSPDKNGEVAPRFRMYFPLLEGMTMTEFQDRKEGIFNGFVQSDDESNSSDVRGYYMPVKRLGYEGEYQFEYQDGLALDGLGFDVDVSVVERRERRAEHAKLVAAGVKPAYGKTTDADMAVILDKCAEVFPDMHADRWWKYIENLSSAGVPIEDTISICFDDDDTIDVIEEYYDRVDLDERSVGGLISKLKVDLDDASFSVGGSGGADTTIEDFMMVGKRQGKASVKEKPKTTAKVQKVVTPVRKKWSGHVKTIKYVEPWVQPIDFVDGVSFIKAPKGTGKTTQLVPLIQKAIDQGLSVLLIGHRIALIRTMSRLLGLSNYKEMTVSDIEGSRHLAICINSIEKIGFSSAMKPYDVVVIDESEQFLQHLGNNRRGGTIKPYQRQGIVSAFHKIVRNAGFVCALDADLSDLTTRNIMRCRDGYDSRVELFVNDYKQVGRSLTMFDCATTFRNDFIRAAKAGKSIFYGADTKAHVNQLSIYLDEQSIDHVLVDRDTSKRKKVQDYIDFLAAATDDEIAGNGILPTGRGEIVLASPSLSTGLDVKGKFDCVFGHCMYSHLTHYDIDQQICRVRNAGEVNVYITPAKRDEDTSEIIIKQRINMNAAYAGELCTGITNKQQESEWYKFLFDLHVDVQVYANKSTNDLRGNFRLLKEAQGWAINHEKK